MLEKINKIILFSALLSLLFLLPCFAGAQTLSLTSDKSTYIIGEEIPVVLSLDTSGKLINVVDGTVNFSSEYFDVQNITAGNSILMLWPKRPTAQEGAIVFTGGVPHGYSGSSGNIFNFILKPKKIGEQIISISNASLLLNDGSGTKITDIALNNLKVSIASAEGQIVPPPQPITDKIKPLPFTPVISRNPSIAENKYFVSFSAADKESGISYYQVREGYVLVPYSGTWLSTGWQRAETPYVLKLQHWWSRVYVRAYDVAGNFRQEVVTKPLDKQGIIILNILIITVSFFGKDDLTTNLINKYKTLTEAANAILSWNVAYRIY